MIPFSTLGEQLDFIARASIAYALMALFFILSISAMPHPLGVLTKIPFIIIIIYYWSIYRPTLVPPILVFAAGLLFDLLSAAPLGLNAILLLAAHWIIADQRRFFMGQPFIVIWLAFGVLNTSIILIQWLVFGVVQTGLSPILMVASDAVLGFLAYPFVAFLIHLTHKILPEPQMPLTRQSRVKDFSQID